MLDVTHLKAEGPTSTQEILADLAAEEPVEHPLEREERIASPFHGRRNLLELVYLLVAAAGVLASMIALWLV